MDIIEEMKRKLERENPGKPCDMPMEYATDQTARIDAVFTEHVFPWMDTAWALMLIKQGVVAKEHLPQVTAAMVKFWDQAEPPDLEFAGIEKFAIAECGIDVGGTLGHGRTIPPYMQMITVRRDLLKLICMLHDLQDALLTAAKRYRDTVMPGYTHIRHAQPETFGHYLLSAYDPMARIMEQIEGGYHLMSLSELGCGALAGTSLPIDRDMVVDYLGLEGIIENSNDAVAYTDGYVTLVAALANLMSVWSRVALDFNYWSSEEFRFLSFPWFVYHPPQSLGGKGKGHSYFMPNKVDNSPYLERARISAAMLQGCLMEVVSQSARSPHGDVVEMMMVGEPTLRAITKTDEILRKWVHALPRMTVYENRMLECVSRGYSCASELSNQLVLKHGLSGRVAHQIVNELVIAARDTNTPANEITVDMLNKAAKSVINRDLKMTQEALTQALDPVNFIKVTTSRGGTSPDECQRMIEERTKALTKARNRHEERIKKIETAKAKMLKDMKELAAKYNT